VARLFGLNPAPASAARVLELGCGDGGNLLSLAQTLPGARFVGLDAAASAIERGEALAAAAGLENVQLRVGNLEELPEEEGEAFDYVISHGVYSWIPPRARVGLLAGMRRHMAPEGVGYVSYNAYPGSHLRDMARDILGYHVRGIEDPQQKLAAARELMQTIVAIEAPSPYAQVLREHMERMLRYSTALLFHDDLAEVATPFYFHEFIEHANHHQLAFLSEADMFESQMREVPESAGRLMEGLGEDAVAREQYLDFFKNRMFRQTLLCHAAAPVNRELDVGQVERFVVSSQARVGKQEGPGEPQAVSEATAPEQAGEDLPAADGPSAETFTTPQGFAMSTTEPLVQAAMHALAQAWPAAVEFGMLLEEATKAAGPHTQRELVAERLQGVLLQAYLARIVVFQGSPSPLSAQPGERPRASPLARAQAAAGRPAVSSLLHANVRLESELENRLLVLLDGTRDREALCAELAEALSEKQSSALSAAQQPQLQRDQLAAQVDTALLRFASLGLLQG
jgi:methyltransferase-like protein/ubiquinone/menaquinone biosynthesis C-methylase UbiE